MLVNDIFHIYAMKHDTETAGILADYRLDSRLDKAALDNYILLELGDRRPYYNDSEVMKFAIDTWFDTHYRPIKVLVDTLYTDYNPLTPNEYWEDEGTSKETNTTHEELLEKNYAPGTSTTQTGVVENTGQDVTEQQISAYNQNGYQDQSRVIEQPNTKTEYNNVKNNIKAESNSQKGFDGETFSSTGDFTKQRELTHDTGDPESNREDRKLHHYGREDVAEIKKKEWLAARYNVYQWIVDNLGDHICLSIF